jgi:nucleoside 2-deoxyribosyltransferase
VTFAKYAIQDLDDIDQAEILVLFAVTGTPIPRAGRHVEFGYALAKNKKLVVVGDVKENIFHYLPGITPFATWEETLQWFKDLRDVERDIV